MRINKAISHNSKYSRREADKLIQDRKVTINGKIVTDLSTKVSEKDKIRVNNKFLHKKNKFTMIVYNKPKGEIVSKKDDRNRKVIFDSLSKQYAHFMPVGRLDYASEGLLLLCDSVNVATALMQSSLERVYYIKIRGKITDEIITAMQDGIYLEDASKGAHELSKMKSMTIKSFLEYKIINQGGEYTRLKVTINEGQNRELRRFFAHFDTDIVDLKRVGFGGISLGNLKEGKSRYLSSSEYENLRAYLKENAIRY